MTGIMARPMYASILPTIKCSDCGVDIAISMMGDHICSGEQAAPSNPYAPSTNHNRLAAFDSSPARLPPQAYSPHPTIHQIPVSQQTPSHYLAPTSRPMHPSPPMHSSSYQEPFGQRHDQYQPSPPSHISQASETRLFVDHRQAPVRSSTEPNTVSRRPPADDVKLAHAPSFPMFPTERASARQDAPDNLLATGNAFDLRPTSPTHTGPVSPGLVNRMNTITSGPFGARSRRPEPASDSRGPYRSPLAAANTTTTTSAQTPASSAEGATAPPRPPRPDSDYGLVQGLRALSTNEHVELTSRALPEQETPTPTSFTLSQAPNPIIPLRPPPVTIPIYDRLDGHRPNTAPSAPEPGMRPLPDYTGLHSAVSRKPSHISTSSSSSSGSRSMFGSRTDSSRSSHSTPFNLRTSVEAHPKAHYLDRDVPNAEQYLSLIAQSEAEESAFGDPSPLLSQSSWNATSPYHSDYRPHTSHSVMTTSPDSMDQPPVTFPMRSESIGRLQPSHNRPSRTSKPKGDCRGCGTPITGRSIKAADGRLTGRYHRECFVCQTCKQNFETAEFYVFNNQPYCAHHYHVLNNSLCHSCNIGIEGKYLETQPLQRYHLNCFACHDCRRPLTSDYYELNQHFYCEEDALRVYEKSRLLTPGKRFPERRTTRLMMF